MCGSEPSVHSVATGAMATHGCQRRRGWYAEGAAGACAVALAQQGAAGGPHSVAHAVISIFDVISATFIENKNLQKSRSDHPYCGKRATTYARTPRADPWMPAMCRAYYGGAGFLAGPRNMLG